MDKSEFTKKIGKMNIDELVSYHTAAKGTNRVLDVVGIGLMLVILNFANIFAIIPCTIVIFIISNISASIGRTINLVEERILELSDK